MRHVGKRIRGASSREKALMITAAVCSLIFSVDHWGFPLPLTTRARGSAMTVSNLTQQKLELLNLLAKSGLTETRITKALAEKETLKSKLAEARRSVTDKNGLNSVLGLLGDTMSESRIALVGLSVASESIPGNIERGLTKIRPARRGVSTVNANNMDYEKNIITISLKSDYQSLTRLFEEFFESPVALSVLKITIKSDGSADALGLTADIELCVYTSLL